MSEYFAHDTAVVDEGAKVGKGTKIWHFCHVMPESEIGEDCVLGQNVFVAQRAIVANSVKIQNNVSIYEGVVCEDFVFLGPSMVFTNVINPRSGIERKSEYRPTYVRKSATIGANATVICGNEIGEFAMVGAGSVITKDVKPYALVVGNPAVQIGWVSKAGMRLEFDETGTAICPMDASKYEVLNGFLKCLTENE